jgi:hypothetical protein
MFLPLSPSSIVFLPPIFQLCGFIPVISKRRNSLPLLCYVMLTMLNMMQKNRVALMIVPQM